MPCTRSLSLAACSFSFAACLLSLAACSLSLAACLLSPATALELCVDLLVLAAAVASLVVTAETFRRPWHMTRVIIRDGRRACDQFAARRGRAVDVLLRLRKSSSWRCAC